MSEIRYDTNKLFNNVITSRQGNEQMKMASNAHVHV
jgi:hypothetical protein